MKRILEWKVFESVEDVSWILTDLSDTKPQMISSKFEDKIIIFDLHRDKKLSQDEIEEINGKLGDVGYKILRVSEHEPTYVLSVIRLDFHKELLEKNVIFWNGLHWTQWSNNRMTASNCLHAKIKFWNKSLSIINGLHDGPNQIDCVEFWCEKDDFEARAYDETSAEVVLIEFQLESI